MFRCVTEINFEQVTNGRSKKLFFNYVHEFNATDTWVDLTNQAEITLPKNLYVKDETGKLFPLSGTNKNIGGLDASQPLFLRGDKVEIRFGYYYFKGSVEVKEIATVFTGYISEVSSKKPFVLKCDDNMWLLKQLPATPQVWKGSVEDLFEKLLKGTGITVNRLTSTTIGQIVVGNETVCQLIERLRKEAHIECSFRGNVLRIGGKVYIDSEAVDHTFVFQQNIISDDLMYKRRDDVILSAVVISNFDYADGKTKDGQSKVKKKRLEILVYWDRTKKNPDGSTGQWAYTKKDNNKPNPENVEGERRTLHFLNITSEKELFEKGVEELQKYYYTGFKGKFETFGIPFVKQGDNVFIKDPVLPERNGKYKVKGVEYTGGVNGHRQSIILDYKIA